MKNNFFVALFWIVFSGSVFASSKQDYYFRHLNTENGLSQNTVLSILQDKTGFMWFGTKDGLNRYDGNSFKIFKYDENNPLSIGNNTIWSLLQTPDGNIWVGTDKGIYIYHTENDGFYFFDCKTETNAGIHTTVMDMQIDQFGVIWIASGDLFRYFTHTGKLEVITFNDIDLPDSEIVRARTINIDKDNQAWIGMHRGGIKLYNPNNKQFNSYTKDALKKDLSTHLVYKTINLEHNYLLIGLSDEDMKIMDKTTGEISPYHLGSGIDTNLFIRNMSVFSDGNCWIATESGLYIHNLKNKTTTHLTYNINDRYSLSDNAVYSLYEDKEGGIWVGTYFGGINYFPRPYTYFEKYYPIVNRNSISGERVSGICEDESGNVWIGTEDNGLNKLDIKTQRIENYFPVQQANGLNYHNIHDLIIDGDFLWIATFSHGINVLNLKTKKWKHYLKGDEEGMLNNNDIFSLFKDSSGNIWVGTSTGAFLFDRKTEKFIPQNQIGRFFISDIIEDSSGKIWFATYNTGAFCYNPRTKEYNHYDYDSNDPHSICYHKITCMLVDSKKRLWFASESRGICMFDEKTRQFIRYGVKDGFSNDVIYKILDDDEGNLWLSSNEGLMRFHPETKTIRIFTRSNGLPGNQFNYKSGYKDKNGKMYFGSLNGLVTFQPADFKWNDYIPPVVITDFRLLNNEKPLKEKQSGFTSITLKYNQSSFSIDFASLSYVAPDMNKYAYRMEGLETNWNQLSSAQKITYSNLPPGKYIFRVKASNNDNLWNEEGDSLAITILPPFWKTLWAYLLYSCLFLGSVYFVFRYYKDKIADSNRRKQIFFEKEKEKEIYNAKIDFFTNVAHEIRTPLTLIRGPLEYILKTEIDKEELNTNLQVMERNTNRLLSLINQLLDFRKTEAHGFSLTFIHININELLEETYIRFQSVALQKNQAFIIEKSAEPIWADVDREALTKIISNLFTNALKYAESSIEIKLTNEQDNFSIRVNNDGKLIPEELSEKIFEPFFRIKEEKQSLVSGSGIGLTLVKSLVELHKGKAYLDTSVKDKNSFVVSLPKKQSHVIDLNNPETTIVESTSSMEDDLERRIKNTPVLLIVEDDEELLQFIVDKLRKQYLIFKAKNGIEAISILENELINLVVSDIVMPKMDGLELCAKIKEDIEYSHIPVVLLTAQTNISSRIAGLELGADAYIEKPFSIEHLQAQISNLLDNRKKILDVFLHSPFVHMGTIALNKSDEQFLNKATEIIYKNISNPDFNVDSLADILCMSRSSLLRKIKGVSGVTPKDFIKLLRLKRAAEILQEGEYRVSEVCFLVGFSTISYFAKAFQKQFGVLPKDFVKKK